MKTHLLRGPIDLSRSEFEEHFRKQIDQAIVNGDGFIVGDEDGADRIFQFYLAGKTKKVTVFSEGEFPRFNLGFSCSSGHGNSIKEAMKRNANNEITWFGD